ncbi:uncharacterized protein LOC127838137 [Dreissena polymorpha]|uniref:uncharacterized protein LOC127838137 n=1 Tax=Dreissena polymorpha TaxID=45954 RepID=UPI002263F219|nr:uncharacterized protein LOC127838137 [Dreissena polymorpha]
MAVIHIGILVLYSLCVCLKFDGVQGKFLGGTVSWMFFQNMVKYTYRLAWEKGTGPCGPGCNISDVGKEVSHLSPEIASLKWVDGNGTTLHNVSYVLTSVSQSNLNGWEQEEAIFKLFDPPSSIHVRIAQNCISVLEIPVEDPDGDKVRCRFSVPSECGGGCTNLPSNSVLLDSVGSGAVSSNTLQCSDDPCLNNGTCAATASSFSCKCVNVSTLRTLYPFTSEVLRRTALGVV